MELYLLPRPDGKYALFSKIEEKEYHGFGKSLVESFHKHEKQWVEEDNLRGKMVSYFRRRLETKEEVIFRHLNRANELLLRYPSSMDSKNLKNNLKLIYCHGRKARIARTAAYGFAAPVSFVISPFVPVLNWGFTLFFIYRFIANLHVLQGSGKLLNNCKYIPDTTLSGLEKIITKQGFEAKAEKMLKGTDYEPLLDYYEFIQKKDI